MGLFGGLFAQESNQTTEYDLDNEFITTNTAIEDSEGAIVSGGGDVNVVDGGAFEILGSGFTQYTSSLERGFRDYANDMKQNYGQSLNLLGEQARNNVQIAQQNTGLASQVINDSLSLASESQRGEGENVLIKFNETLKYIVLGVAAFMIFKGLS